MKSQGTEMFEEIAYDYSVISGAVTTRLSGELILKNVIVNRGTSGQSFVMYDSSSGNQRIVALIGFGDAFQAPVTLEYNVKLTSGLCVVTTGELTNLTVTYKK